MTTETVIKGGKEILSMEIARGENIRVNIRVAPEIEMFFQQMSTGKKTSDNWKFENGDSPSYYDWKSDGIDELANAFMSSYLNSYGNRFFDGEKANVAILRTVGISRGVSIIFDGMVTKESLEEFSSQIRSFVVQLYKQFIRKVIIRVNMSIEELM